MCSGPLRLTPYRSRPMRRRICRALRDLHGYLTFLPEYRRFKRRGAPGRHRLRFLPSCCLRRNTSGSALPFIRSPINNRGGCYDGATFCVPVRCGLPVRRWPTMGSGHACRACFALAAYAATTCPRLTGSKVLPVRGLLTSLECALPGTLCISRPWRSGLAMLFYRTIAVLGRS